MYGSLPTIDRSSDQEEIQSKETVASSRKNILVYSTIFALFVGALLFGAFYQSGSLAKSFASVSFYSIPATSDILSAAQGSLLITATNEYGQFTAPYPWMNDVYGTQLIEPYKATTLTLSGTYIDNADYSYVWVIEGQDENLSGAAPVLTLTSVGKYTVDVHAFDSAGAYVSTFSTLFICK